MMRRALLLLLLCGCGSDGAVGRVVQHDGVQFFVFDAGQIYGNYTYTDASGNQIVIDVQSTYTVQTSADGVVTATRRADVWYESGDGLVEMVATEDAVSASITQDDQDAHLPTLFELVDDLEPTVAGYRGGQPDASVIDEPPLRTAMRNVAAQAALVASASGNEPTRNLLVLWGLVGADAPLPDAPLLAGNPGMSICATECKLVTPQAAFGCSNPHRCDVAAEYDLVAFIDGQECPPTDTEDPPYSHKMDRCYGACGVGCGGCCDDFDEICPSEDSIITDQRTGANTWDAASGTFAGDNTGTRDYTVLATIPQTDGSTIELVRLRFRMMGLMGYRWKRGFGDGTRKKCPRSQWNKDVDLTKYIGLGRTARPYRYIKTNWSAKACSLRDFCWDHDECSRHDGGPVDLFRCQRTYGTRIGGVQASWGRPAGGAGIGWWLTSGGKPIEGTSRSLVTKNDITRDCFYTFTRTPSNQQPPTYTYRSDLKMKRDGSMRMMKLVTVGQVETWGTGDFEQPPDYDSATANAAAPWQVACPVHSRANRPCKHRGATELCW